MTDIEYDPATGLPELPTNYRWRVTNIDSWGTWQVKMQRMLWGWLPVTVEHRGSQKVPGPDHIRNLAERVLQDWKYTQMLYAGNPYRGNYPPKRLENS